MPRRYYTYAKEFETLNIASTAGASLLFFGFVTIAVYLGLSLRYGRVSGATRRKRTLRTTRTLDLCQIRTRVRPLRRFGTVRLFGAHWRVWLARALRYPRWRQREEERQ